MLGCYEIVTPQLGQIILGVFLYGCVHMHHMLNDGLAMSGGYELVAAQEELGHCVERLFRPREYPINVGAANETGKAAAAIA